MIEKNEWGEQTNIPCRIPNNLGRYFALSEVEHNSILFKNMHHDFLPKSRV